MLRRQAERLRGVVAGVDGVRDPRVELPAAEPTLEVKVDLAAARRHGILPGDVRRAVATIVSGLEVGSFFEQQKVFAVVVRGVPATAHSVDSVRELLLDAPGGGHVRLGDVASVAVQPTPVDIRHDAVSRYVDVARRRGAGGASAPCSATSGGGCATSRCRWSTTRRSSPSRATRAPAAICRRSSSRALSGSSCCCRPRSAAGAWPPLVLGLLPLAVVGGLVVAVLDGGDLSLGELAGLFAVFAIAVHGLVALVRHLQLVEEQGGPGRRPCCAAPGSASSRRS